MNDILEIFHQKGSVMIAIDGDCGSGKTTLSQKLADELNANVFHLDDYFLRPEQKTSERLKEVGGNVDRERFKDEVLNSLLQKQSVKMRAYDCKQQALLEEQRIPYCPINIIEGSYSLHPELFDYYDYTIFIEIEEEKQYFKEMKIKEKCNILLKG